MSIILKRPMFRRGGSTEGGITTGLSTRTGYQNPIPGTVGDQAKFKEIIEFLNKQKQAQQAKIDASKLPDFLTAFGSTAGKAKTFGEAAGQAGAGAAALRMKRQEGVDKYSQALDQQLLRIFANDKEKMNSFKVTLRAKAENAVRQGKYKTIQEAENALFDEVYNDVIKRTRASKSYADKVADEAKIILANEELKTTALASRGAAVAVKIKDGTINVPGGYIGYIKATKGGVSDIVIQGDGKVAMANTKKQGYNSATFDQSYTQGQNYIDPITQSVYQYQGKGTFRRVYP